MAWYLLSMNSGQSCRPHGTSTFPFLLFVLARGRSHFNLLSLWKNEVKLQIRISWQLWKHFLQLFKTWLTVTGSTVWCPSNHCSSRNTMSFLALKRFGLNTMSTGRRGHTQGSVELRTHGKQTCTHILLSREFTCSHCLKPGLQASFQQLAWHTIPHSQPRTAILWLPSLTGGTPRHFASSLPYRRCTPPFCASPPSNEVHPNIWCSPPSQEAHPAILCLPSLTRGAPCHFVLPLPHKTHTPPFCASPPSQEAYPTILCLPLVTEGSSLGTSCVTDTASQLGCKTDLKLTLPALEKIAFLSLLLTLLTFWVQTD